MPKLLQLAANTSCIYVQKSACVTCNVGWKGYWMQAVDKKKGTNMHPQRLMQRFTFTTNRLCTLCTGRRDVLSQHRLQTASTKQSSPVNRIYIQGNCATLHITTSTSHAEN